MDQNLDNHFILKGKKLKDILFLLNQRIKRKLENSLFYKEDSKFFLLDKINLKINSFTRTHDLILNKSSIYPSFVILKSKKINNVILKKDEWLIINFDLKKRYQSESMIYAFSLS